MADYILDGHPRAPCKMLPPKAARQEPTAPYKVVTWPQAKVQTYCAAGRKTFQPITACANPLASGAWVVAVSDFLSPTDRACILIYEKAHLPPNDWIDQRWEDQGFKGTPY